ncbi:MAG: 1,4-alpha-glucan branching protein GlgB [Planctomycetota bacterium]
MALDAATLTALERAQVGDPFSVLGLHREGDGTWWIRAWQREADAITLHPRDGGPAIRLARRGDCLFESAIPHCSGAFAYELAVTRHGETRRVRDPYSFWPQLEEFDLQRFAAGGHHHLEHVLGACVCEVDGAQGTRFAVWAPNAQRVSVIGEWNGFDGRWHPMRRRDPYGVWELFIPDVGPGQLYKYEIRGPGGELRIKADPYARHTETPPATASIVVGPPQHEWSDDAWMVERTRRDPLRAPMATYEVHLGSWQRGEGDRRLTYAEIAPRLIEHCRNCGFNWVEFLPLASHPFEGSWGYQGTGQYAANSRHGDPDGLRYLIDQLHCAGIGVIVDYVPGHFPKDDFALGRFDGTPCYEYGDPREGEHRDWGTMVFNLRRPEVRNYLLGAALYWLREFHIDGLRVDAVSSMLYRDYAREAGEWVPNEHGGNENVETVSFFRELNHLVHDLFPGVLTIAEESTAWVGVTAQGEHGGLGFDLKWNMGWMHDTLRYLSQEPVMRVGCHDWITFHQWYAYDERWVLPLSHDEVVHGKGSLLDKMSGEYAHKLAQLRLLYGYQAAVPGRPLLFQGAEIGQGREWNWEHSVDWHEGEESERQGLCRWVGAAMGLYVSEPALHRHDDDREGFCWVDVENRRESLLAFLRRAPDAPDVLVVCNFTPVPRPSYPLGVPRRGTWEVLLNSDAAIYAGGGDGPDAGARIEAHDEPLGIWAGVIRVDLPAFGILLIRGPESSI